MRISDWSSDVCSSDLLPKFVNRNHHALACQERVYPLEQVEHDRRADFRVFEEVGHIEAHETGFERHGIFLIIENPAKVPLGGPLAQARTAAPRAQLGSMSCREGVSVL